MKFTPGKPTEDGLYLVDAGASDVVKRPEALNAVMGIDGVLRYFFTGDSLDYPSDITHFIKGYYKIEEYPTW